MSKLASRLLAAGGVVVAAMSPPASHAAGSSGPVTAAGYYNEYVTSDCAAGSGCSIAFTAVPSKHNLLITSISCSIRASGTSLLSRFFLTGTKTTAINDLIPVFIATETGGDRHIYSNDVISRVFKSGDQPTVITNYSATTNADLICGIGGQLL